MKQPTVVRTGKKADTPQIFALVKELAAFEKASNEVTLTEKQFLQDGFGAKPLFKTIVAELNWKIVGMGVYCLTYSTWKGKEMYLIDLMVAHEHQKKGIGTKLFEEILRISQREGTKRFRLDAYNWNTPAIEFYKKYGGKPYEDWRAIMYNQEQLEKAYKKLKSNI